MGGKGGGGGPKGRQPSCHVLVIVIVVLLWTLSFFCPLLFLFFSLFIKLLANVK